MRRRLLFPSLAALALALAACSSNPTTGAGPTTTTASGSSSSSVPAGSKCGGTGSNAPTVTTATMPGVTNPTDLCVAPSVHPGMAPPPTTLQTKDLVVGTGQTATAADTVVVQYVGADYATGQTFDSSWSRGMPATFPLSEVVPGFAQGIEGMKVGGRREIVIPPALGYGAAGKPPAVGPNETLVFVVDLKQIEQ